MAQTPDETVKIHEANITQNAAVIIDWINSNEFVFDAEGNCRLQISDQAFIILRKISTFGSITLSSRSADVPSVYLGTTMSSESAINNILVPELFDVESYLQKTITVLTQPEDRALTKGVHNIRIETQYQPLYEEALSAFAKIIEGEAN